MKIGQPRHTGEQVAVIVTCSDRDFEIWYRAPQLGAEFAADSFVIACLLPAMTRGATLRSSSAVSAQLLANIPNIQDLVLSWEDRGWEGLKRPGLTRIDIAAAERPAARPPAGKAAALFTAGADSFYTALKNADEIDALVYVHGYDLSLDRSDALPSVLAGIRGAAARLGKPLLEIVSNLQSFSSRYLSWGPYHGAALASVAPLLAHRFGRLYVPASFSYDDVQPWGSHPSLDPLWSTEQVEIVYDGCELTRESKLKAIADNTVAREYLRVCLDNPGGRYNCSVCEKCLRTMSYLRQLGVLESFISFPHFEPESMRFELKPRVPASIWRPIWSKRLKELEESGQDPVLQEAMRRILNV